MPDDLERRAEILWGTRGLPRRGPRPKLTLDEIVAGATALADAQGLAGLSMPTLAQRLGCAPMSLYRYVSDKDELLNLMFDTALGPPVPLAGLPWRQALTAWAEQQLRLFLDHPWMIEYSTHTRLLGPNETAHTEAALEAAAGTGLPLERRLEIAFAVNSLARGAAQVLVGVLSGRGPRWPEAVLDDPRFPGVSALIRSPMFAPDYPYDAGFAFGLGRFLDGIEQLIA